RVKNSLPGLAQYFFDHPNHADFKALLGVTILTRGVKSLGFQTIDIANPIYRTFKKLSHIPIFLLFHPPKSLNHLKKGQLTPKYIVMSKERFMDQYNHNT